MRVKRIAIILMFVPLPTPILVISMPVLMASRWMSIFKVTVPSLGSSRKGEDYTSGSDYHRNYHYNTVSSIKISIPTPDLAGLSDFDNSKCGMCSKKGANLSCDAYFMCWFSVKVEQLE